MGERLAAGQPPAAAGTPAQPRPASAGVRLFGIALPEHVPSWIKPWLGTKFIVTILAMTGSMLALASGWITDGVWLASMNLSVGTYVAGNAYVTGQAIKSAAQTENNS